ncbi:MAG: nuclear transport factor 2 family protein [Bacteroidota bacterium]
MKSTLTILITFICATALAQSNLAEQNRKIALGVFEAFNAHNWELMISHYHQDVILEDPSLEGTQIGTSGMKEKYEGYAEYVPNIQDAVVNIYAFDQNVVIEFISHGTTVEGETFSLPICTVMTIKDGKITRDATYYDLTN